MKTKLYLDVDGIFLRRTGRQTSRGMTEFQIANSAVSFLRWCTDNFDCYWLTARSREGDIAEVERAFRQAVRNQNSSEQERADLKDLVSGIPVARWGAMKATAFTSEQDFFWIDDNPDEASLTWLEQHGLSDRLVVASTDQRHDDLVRVQGILNDRRTRSVTILESTHPGPDGRARYEIAGDTRGAVERLGRVFFDIWGPDHAPDIAAPELSEDGFWFSVASRTVDQDLSLFDQAKLADGVISDRNAGVYSIGDNDEIVHVPVTSEEAQSNAARPIEDYEKDGLLSLRDFSMSRHRYPPIYFEYAEPALYSLSEPANPGVARGYYVEPVCMGCTNPEGPFETAADALTWIYQEYAASHLEAD